MNRSDVATALLDLIATAAQGPDEIDVTDSVPSDPARESIYLGDIVPVSTEPVYWPSTDTREKRQDIYDIHVHHWAGKPGQSATEARARAEALAVFTDEILATQTLDADGLMMAYVSSYDGPNVEPAGEGYIGMETIAVRIMVDYV